MYNPELIKNHVYSDFPMCYDPMYPEWKLDADGNRVDIPSGMTVLDNGDIEFRVYAPDVKDVYLTSWDKKVQLVKDETGMWTGKIEFDPGFYGPHSVDIFFDGTCLLYPYMPISWHRDRPVNYVDLPDPDTQWLLMRDVPHGGWTRELFWSDVLGRWERCTVYTPAGYMKGTDDYPVLYLQHGHTENEITWEYNGRVSQIMDNLIADGKCTPMIIVMNCGMVRKNMKTGYRDSNDTTFIDMLVQDCIPYIEKTYRVKPGKENRGMAGLSMGSMQTSKLTLLRPDLFDWVGIFSGFIQIPADRNPDHEYLKGLYRPTFAEDYKLFYRTIGDGDEHFHRFLDDDKLCADAGIDKLPNYMRVVQPGQRHEFGAWRRALYDFAQRIFK